MNDLTYTRLDAGHYSVKVWKDWTLVNEFQTTDSTIVDDIDSMKLGDDLFLFDTIEELFDYCLTR